MKKHYLTRFFALVFFFGAIISLTNAQTFTVTAPASIAGEYASAASAFGPQFDNYSGELVEITDTDGLTTACVAIDNGVTDVTGKVALIDRGACAFTQKVLNAQAAGAIAVVICNNDMAAPDAIFGPGGDDMCQSTTPTVMLSFNDCQTIRAETGIMVDYTAPDLPGPTETYDTAIEIGEGSFTVDTITGTGGLFANSVAGAFYAYTPSDVGVVTVSSCGGGADTRLIIGQGDCAGSFALVTFSIDDCDDGGGNVVASTVDLLVFPDQVYYILWDDAQSASGFDFTVTLNPLPTVNVTFTVNMEEETVATDGVFFHYDINDTPTGNELMTDNGDGTWSYTLEVTTLDTINYVYCNGAGNFEVVPAECAFPNFEGNPVREHVMLGITDGALPPVCYSLCTNCPSVNVTFTVDMSNETVSAAGVTMAWGTSPTDQNVTPLTDNGNGTWSGTISVMTGDTIGYFFANGANPITDLELVPDECGTDSGAGFNVRTFIVEGFDDISVEVVCFGACTSFCPSLGCDEAATVMENMDSYELGSDVTTQSDIWVLWPAAGVIGGEVSDEQAASPPHSVKLQGGGATGTNDLVDPLLNLGAVSSGAWDIRFKMYVPAGGSGYYNIQNNEGANPSQWNVEVGFEADGTLGVDLAGAGEYPQGEWFDIVNIIDVDNERGEIIINGLSVYTWTYGPDWSIGAFNFFPRSATEVYYIDDVIMRPIFVNGGNCPEGSIICTGFESYADGSELTPQSADWILWPFDGVMDGIVTTEQAANGCNGLLIAEGQTPDIVMLLGDRTSGRYEVSWNMYIPADATGYFNIQEAEEPGVAWNMDVFFNQDGGAPGTGLVQQTGTTFTYPEDTWFRVTNVVDLDNDLLSLEIDGTVVESAYAYPGNLGGLNFFSIDAMNRYFLDDVLFIGLPAIPGNVCGGATDVNDQLGGGVGTIVSSGPYDNTDYTSTGDPEDGWDCFGEPDGGGAAPSLERTVWFTFTGDGNTYFIEANECGDDPIDFGDTQIAIYSGDCGSLTPVACVDDGPNAMAGGPFPAGLEFETEDGVTYYMFVDGFGPDFPADGEFCLEFTQLTQANIDVTFRVDMTNEVNWGGGVANDGVFLAGEFNAWTGQPMNDMGNNIWELTVAVSPNDTVEYKYQNGEGGWEEELADSEGGPCTLGDTNNRFIETGTDPIQLDPVCFNQCLACGLLDIDETVLENGVSIFPNPAKDIVNVRFELSQATDNLHLRMLNALGQTVYTTKLGQVQAQTVEVNVSELPAGAYMIQLVDGETQVSRSVVVE